MQLAAAMGMRPIVVDTGDEREKLAKHHGAEHFVDFQKDDTVKKVLEITEGGAHGVFVTAVQAYPTALGYLGIRGGGKMMWYVVLPEYGSAITDVHTALDCLPQASTTSTLILQRLSSETSQSTAPLSAV